MSLLVAGLWLVVGTASATGDIGSFGFVEEKNAGSPCYERLADGNEDLLRPQRCMPPFKNVVAKRRVTVTPIDKTCGVARKNTYCVQTGYGFGNR